MPSIDDRVVKLSLDNKDFESNAKTSLNTLDSLDSKIKSGSSGTALLMLGKAANSVSQSFSAMEVAAVTALSNIVNKAVNAGEALVSNLTVKQVSAGWDKYADKTSAVQTIMAATAKDFEDVGVQMQYVNEQLDKLNWFTDETSYNFLDMVNNIGKFTSNGVKLDAAIDAMQGISTWAAISGGDPSVAGRVMYNLSQAMSVGAVKLLDWKSIQNANMTTREFKETVISVAEELGTIKKITDDKWIPIDAKDDESNYFDAIKNFDDSLSTGWFSSDVLMETLSRYGKAATKLYEIGELTGLTATEILEATDDFKEGTLDLTQLAKECGASVEELHAGFETLTSDEYELGLRAFRASQEAKTFKEAIDSVVDAVSTGWMTTFELIFGNYEEAKELWTWLANELYDVFAESGNERNALLKDWHEGIDGISGYTLAVEALHNAFDILLIPINAAKTAFHDIFPAMTVERLISLTQKFRDGTQKILDWFGGVRDEVEDIAESITNPITDALGDFSSGLTKFIGSDISDLAETLYDLEQINQRVRELADEVWAGKWGNGNDRRRMLEAAGWSYELTMNTVNSDTSWATFRYPVTDDDYLKMAETLGAWLNLSETARNYMETPSQFLSTGVAEYTQGMGLLNTETAEYIQLQDELANKTYTNQENLIDTLRGIFSIVDIFKQLGEAITETIIDPISKKIPDLLTELLSLTGDWGRKITDWVRNLRSENTILNFFKQAKEEVTAFYEQFKIASGMFIEAVKQTDSYKLLKSQLDGIKDWFNGLDIVDRFTAVVEDLKSQAAELGFSLEDIFAGATFEGLLTVVDWVIDKITILIDFLSPLKDWIGSLIDGLFNELSTINLRDYFDSDSLSGFINTLDGGLSVVKDTAKAVSEVADSLDGGLSVVKDTAKAVGEVADSVNEVVDAAEEFAGGMFRGNDRLRSATARSAGGLTGQFITREQAASGGVNEFISGAAAVASTFVGADVEPAFTTGWSVLDQFLGTLSSSIPSIDISAIVNFFTETDWLSLADKVLEFGKAIAAIKLAFTSAKTIKQMGGMFTSISGFLDRKHSPLLSIDTSLQSTIGTVFKTPGVGFAAAIVSLGGTMLMIANAFKKLADIDPESLNRVIPIMAVIAGVLVVLGIVMTIVSTNCQNIQTFDFTGIGIALVGFGGGIYLIVSAIQKLSSVNLPSDVGEKMLAIAGAIGGLVGLIVLVLNKLNELYKIGSLADVAEVPSKLVQVVDRVTSALKGFSTGFALFGLAATMLSFGIMLNQLVKAMEKLAKADFTGIWDNMVPIVIMLIMFAGLLKSANGVRAGTGVGATILILDILLFVKVLQKLAEYPLSEIARQVPTLISIIGMMALLFLSTRLIGDKPLRTGIAVFLMAEAVNVIAKAMSTIASIPAEGAGLALRSITTFLLEFIILTEVASGMANPKVMTSIGAGFILIAAAILVLSYAMNVIGSMKDESWKRGFSAIATFLAEFTGIIAVTNLTGGKGSASRFLVTCIGMIAVVVALAYVFERLNKLDANKMQQQSESLSLIIGVIGALATLCAILGNAEKFGLGFKNTMKGFGAFAIIMVGLVAIFTGIGALFDNFKGLGSAFDTGLSTFGKLATFFTTFGDSIAAIVIACSILGGVLTGVAKSGVGVIAYFIPEIGAATVGAVLAIIALVTDLIGCFNPETVNTGIGILTAIAEFIDESGASIGTLVAVCSIVGEVLAGAAVLIGGAGGVIAVLAPEIGAATVAAVTAIITGLFYAIGDLDGKYDIESKVERAVTVLTTISNGLGQIVGAFEGGEYQAKLEGQAKGLEALSPALETMSGGIDTFRESLAKFTGVEESITKLQELPTLITDLANIGKDYKEKYATNFETAVEKYGGALVDLNEKFVSGGLSVTSLTPILNALPKIADAFSGFNDAASSFTENKGKKFEKAVDAYAPALKKLADELKDVTINTVVLTALTSSAKDMASISGDVYTFDADRFTAFTYGVRAYANAIRQIVAMIGNEDFVWDEEKFDAIITIGQKFTTLYDDSVLQDTGGTLQEFTGEKSLTEFADGIKAYAKAVVDINNNVVAGFTPATDDWDEIIAVGKKVGELYDSIPNFIKLSGGNSASFLNFHVESGSLEAFAEDIASYIQGMNRVNSILNGFDNKTLIENAKSVMPASSPFADKTVYEVPDELFEWNYDPTIWDNFVAIGKKMGELYSVLPGMNIDISEEDGFWTKIGKFVENFSNVNEKVNGLGDFGSAISTYATKIREVANNLKAAGFEASDIDIDLFTQLASAGAAFGDLNEIASSWNSSKINTFTKSIGSGGLAAALSDYWTSVSSIDWIQFNMSISSLSSMMDVMNSSQEFSTDTDGATAMVKMLGPVTEALKSSFASAIIESSTDISASGEQLAGYAADGIEKGLEKFKTAGIKAAGKFAEGISDSEAMATATSNAEALANHAALGVYDAYEAFYNAGIHVAKGFANGLTAVNSYVAIKASELAQKALDTIRTVTDQASPSKVTYGYGVYVGEGFANGIAAMTDPVGSAAEQMSRSAMDNMSSLIVDKVGYSTEAMTRSAIEGAGNAMRSLYGDNGLLDILSSSISPAGSEVIAMARNSLNGVTDSMRTSAKGVSNAALDGMNEAMGYIYDMATGALEYDPVIRPVLDLSSVRAGASKIGSLLSGGQISLDSSRIRVPSSVAGRNNKDSGQTQQTTINNNFYVQDMDQAHIDYFINRVNAQLGVRV